MREIRAWGGKHRFSKLCRLLIVEEQGEILPNLFCGTRSAHVTREGNGRRRAPALFPLFCFAWGRERGGIKVKNDAGICHIFHHFQALLKAGCLLNVLPYFFFLSNVPAPPTPLPRRHHKSPEFSFSSVWPRALLPSEQLLKFGER